MTTHVGVISAIRHYKDHGLGIGSSMSHMKPSYFLTCDYGSPKPYKKPYITKRAASICRRHPAKQGPAILEEESLTDWGTFGVQGLYIEA